MAWSRISAIIALLWAVEMFYFQEITLHAIAPILLSTEIFTRIFRATLDILFAFTLVFLLIRWGLYLMFVVFSIASTLMLVYFDYYNHALSITVLLSQAGEGGGVAGFVFSMLDWHYVAVMLLGLVVKVWLVEKRYKLCAERNCGRYRKFAAVFFAAYFGLYLVLTLFVDPQSKMKAQGRYTIDRMGMTYGYLLNWAAEYYFRPNEEQIIQNELARNKDLFDTLSGKEFVPRIDSHLVVIQVESLGFDAVDYKINGKYLVPFFHSLKDESMFFKIRALHHLGSCDADFAVLCGQRPSEVIINYALKEYPYENCLPKVLSNAGFHTVAIHGNNGHFFKRRYAFGRMGFDEIWFEEELVQRAKLIVHDYAWGIDDVDVFDFSLKLLDQRSHTPQFHFIITLTSHGPFTYTPPTSKEIFSNPKTMQQRYMNAIRYTDRATKRYVESLPDGTVVVIYGDHPSLMIDSEVETRNQSRKEFVPFYVYKKGENLSQRQLTRNSSLAMDGVLTDVDVYFFVRRMVKASQK